MPKTLTIFTPAYNRAHTIPRLYESLCNQTSPDFEWLIVDDGSSDATKTLIESYLQEDKIAMRYIYQENREGYACSQAGHQKYPEDERHMSSQHNA